MSQTGFTPILLYASGTTGATPSPSNLITNADGCELAINYADGILFYKDGAGTVREIQGGGGGGGGSRFLNTDFTATAGQTTFVVAYTVGNIAVYRNGVKLGLADFTATTGTDIVLSVGANAGDLIQTAVFTSSNGSVLTTTDITASAGQTVFSVTYEVGFIEVYLNGIKLGASDYTASDGTTVVLATAANLNDLFEAVVISSTTTIASFSAGTTGFTPSTPSTGSVVLGGTLNATHGGTGLSAVGASGNVLTSNGTTWVSSAPVAGLPSQTGQAGNYLITDGTNASWNYVYSIGTTNERPVSPFTGQLRYNTSYAALEVYSASGRWQVFSFVYAPSIPTIGTATTVSNTSASVTFTANPNASSENITNYIATSIPGGLTGSLGSGTPGPITVSGLTPNTNYTFTVAAVNSVGSSPQSTASNSIKTFGVADAPTIGTATVNGGVIDVTFTPPVYTGGVAITSYVATSSPGNFTFTSATSPISCGTSGGLSAGVPYTFTVQAVNTYGTGAASAASNAQTIVSYAATALVVAGGGGGGPGGGGAGQHGSGAGAGGFLTSAETFIPGTTYTMIVGGGGGGGSGSGQGSNGGGSSLSGANIATLAATGGGGGGFPSGGGGLSGGSGGGGGFNGGGGAGIPGQGNNGGSSSGPLGAAGGGAGAAGGAQGGAGGIGLQSSITGTATYYAGGGAGGLNGSPGAGGGGGVVGGGAGTGVNGLGGGGGPGWTNAPGGSGGSGTVIISVPTSSYSGVTTGSPTVTTSGGNTILIYNSSGTYRA